MKSRQHWLAQDLKTSQISDAAFTKGIFALISFYFYTFSSLAQEYKRTSKLFSKFSAGLQIHVLQLLLHLYLMKISIGIIDLIHLGATFYKYCFYDNS